MTTRPGSKMSLNITQVREGGLRRNTRTDQVVTEEPLEIRLVLGDATHSLAITMRTPGADFELAAGFLFSEGLIHSPADIDTISYCVDRELDGAQRYNVVNVRLRPAAGSKLPDLRALHRHFVVSSACGVCGKTSIKNLERHGLKPPDSSLRIAPEILGRLLSELRQAQRLFDITGGLHAAALFNVRGELIALREDVGRHNAMDKLIGWNVLEGRTRLDDHIVIVSGRASFELVQKALSAGIPVFCAISAPSSLAVRLASHFGMTLIGFLREDGFNIYCGQGRIVLP